jgi:tetratricopeptide (TPR) repeat protein
MTPAYELRRLKVALPLLLYFCLPASSYAQSDSFQRGLAALKENRMEDALVELTSAERQHPDDPLVRNFRGIALAGLDRNGEADTEYREAIRLNPQFEDAYRNLGFLKWTEKEFDAAHDALRRAVELSPGDSFAHYYLGRVELDQQNYAAAMRDLDTSRVPLPADADFSIQLAAAYIALERTEDARQVLASLKAKSLGAAQSIRLAGMFLALQKKDEAVAAIQRLADQGASRAPSWQQFDLALVYLLSGDFERATSQANAYKNDLPGDDSKLMESAEAWTIIGIAAARLKQNESALKAFENAAALRPEEEEYWLNWTRELMELSRYSDALAAVQQGIAANPKSYALQLRFGAAQLAGGHYAEAEHIFRELAAAGDPLPNSYVGLAQVLMRTGRAAEASEEIAAAEKKLGANFLFSYFRGLALERAGRAQEALHAFQEAEKLNPASAEAHVSVGKMQLNLGHLPEAIAELEQTLRLSPENEQARRLLSKAYTRAGDSKRAASFGATPTSAVPETEDNLIGDFFVPAWKTPPENQADGRLDRKESKP